MIYAIGLFGLCLAWLIPGHYFPWTSFPQEATAAVGIALVALAALVSTENRKLAWPRLSMLMALLAVVPLLQWSAGLFPFVADAVLPALYVLAFALSVVAAAALCEDKGASLVAGVFGCFLAAAVASTGIALTQWLRLGNFDLVEA